MRVVLALVLSCLALSASAQEIYQTADGRRCIESWISQTVSRLNGHQGTDDFNLRKPWSINQYGVFEAKGIRTAYEPDNWAESGGTRDSWMWNNYTTEDAYPSWDNENFRNARVQGFRSFVRACVGGGSAESSPQRERTSPLPTVAPVAVPQSATCPDTIGLLIGHPGVVLGCHCPPLDKPGSVWGSHPYTSDSALCSAAVHAEAVSAAGGVVWATVGPGLETYSGSARNGITSRDYGTWGTSLMFLNLPVTRQLAPQVAACPGNMTGQIGSLTCHCSPAALSSGSVWGSGPYTNDSTVCRAALHAGAVGPDGGTVTVVAVDDAGTYSGTTVNGVTSSDYGPWRGAFIFR